MATTAPGEQTTMTSTRPSVVRTARDALTALPSLVYLGVVTALWIWAIVVSNMPQPDGSFAAVVPFMATAPVSLLMLGLPDHLAFLLAASALGALVNAFVIGWCYRTLRARPAS
ncbi:MULTISPECIES: SCO4225 family membrane protein [unclassified Streptomyces]|uniref:SCO4225 family membrane protein n=1 Tax=unclassified Streptomyces TaxID=2593676 RepID=UPI0021565306|nr:MULTISPECIES: hypothetical protein [unclassified Streptomyces]